MHDPVSNGVSGLRKTVWNRPIVGNLKKNNKYVKIKLSVCRTSRTYTSGEITHQETETFMLNGKEWNVTKSHPASENVLEDIDIERDSGKSVSKCEPNTLSLLLNGR
jgi:hypothetical protein